MTQGFRAKNCFHGGQPFRTESGSSESGTFTRNTERNNDKIKKAYRFFLSKIDTENSYQKKYNGKCLIIKLKIQTALAMI